MRILLAGSSGVIGSMPAAKISNAQVPKACVAGVEGKETGQIISPR